MCYKCGTDESVLIPELESLLMGQDRFLKGEFKEERIDYEVNKPAPARPNTVVKYNTDLNAPYFGGNFNFLYNGGANEATITFNTYLSFRKNYSPKEKSDFETRLRNAVSVWDNAAAVQVKDKNGQFNTINLRFKYNPVRDKKNANKITDIHPSNTWSSWFNGKNREIVMRELNVFIGSSENVLVHELGHVWGLLDEYDTKWIEMKFSPGHVGNNSPLIKDTKSVMNIGYQDGTGEFRTRHFVHFGRAIAAAFWKIPNYVIPVMHNGKQVSKTIQGRIMLLKKDMSGSPALHTDLPPFNPRYSNFQLARR